VSQCFSLILDVIFHQDLGFLCIPGFQRFKDCQVFFARLFNSAAMMQTAMA
jgi:hypothetical protein